MGYRPPTTGQKLDFTGTPYEGLEVTVDSAPIGMVLDITATFAAAREPGADTAARMRDLLAKFAGVLESWNVEDRRGEPVPATLEGVLSQDTEFVMAVVEAWLTGTTGAGDGLGKDSPSGATSEEALIPMDVLSQSPPSSSPPRLLSACATAGTSCRAKCWPSPLRRCGCWTSTTWGIARREVRTDGRQLCVAAHQGDRRGQARPRRPEGEAGRAEP